MKSVAKFIVLALTLAFGIDARQPPIAFVDVTVVPMDKEQILSHQIVLVVSGRIAQVGTAASVKALPMHIESTAAANFCCRD